MDDAFYWFGDLTEEELLKFLDEGYITCKKDFFGRKTYEVTDKGMEYFKENMFDKLKYIQ